MKGSPEFLFGMLVAFALVALFALLFRRVKQDLAPTNWREECGRAEHRGDQWRALFERQRFIDDHSPAAARHEQIDIDRRARVLGMDVRETRRTQP